MYGDCVFFLPAFLRALTSGNQNRQNHDESSNGNDGHFGGKRYKVLGLGAAAAAGLAYYVKQNQKVAIAGEKTKESPLNKAISDPGVFIEGIYLSYIK